MSRQTLILSKIKLYISSDYVYKFWKIAAAVNLLNALYKDEQTYNHRQSFVCYSNKTVIKSTGTNRRSRLLVSDSVLLEFALSDCDKTQQ